MTDSGPDASVLHPPPELAESLELVRRGRQGDRAALNDLVLRYQDRVRRIVSIRIGSRLRGVLDSLDLAQDTWAAALRGLPDFEPRGHGSIIRWLARIAENQVLDAADRLHAARRDVRRERAGSEADPGSRADSPSDAAPAVFPAAPGPTPSEDASRRELRANYDACVARLDPVHRDVILLRDYAMLEWTEVCEQLGRPNVHATQELYRRAQLKLGGLLRTRLQA